MSDRQIADMWKHKYDNVTMSAFLDKLTSLHDTTLFLNLTSLLINGSLVSADKMVILNLDST